MTGLLARFQNMLASEEGQWTANSGVGILVVIILTIVVVWLLVRANIVNLS